MNQRKTIGTRGDQRTDKTIDFESMSKSNSIGNFKVWMEEMRSLSSKFFHVYYIVSTDILPNGKNQFSFFIISYIKLTVT